jgi:hypothetical protein
VGRQDIYATIHRDAPESRALAGCNACIIEGAGEAYPERFSMSLLKEPRVILCDSIELAHVLPRGTRFNEPPPSQN